MHNFIFSLLLALMLIGCGDTAPAKTPDNGITTEQIKVSIYVNTRTVNPGEFVDFSTKTTDDILSYQWTDQNGELLSSEASMHWKAPKINRTYTINFLATNKQQVSTHASIDITVLPEETQPEVNEPKLTHDGSFSDIQTILNNSAQGHISDATYICVGDSTRAESQYEGQYLFYQLKETLQKYNVTSYLLARAGHEVKDFLEETASPTWREVIDYIPSNGEHTIVDISLGVNDYWAYRPDRSIKDDIKASILKIKAVKPQTNFVLSMPDRVYGDEVMTNKLRSIYIALSQELKIPLNNVVNTIMPTQEETLYSWYRHDGFNVHLSKEGQSMVADYILGNMLP